MLVVPIASTFLHVGDDNPMGYQIHYDGSHGIDQLAELAGRNCYQSFGRPNPATATNKDYLAHIIESQHFSVLAHGSVTFYVEGVSRSLTHELIRHRFLVFSELSQRYVNMDDSFTVVPPLFQETEYDTLEVATLKLAARDEIAENHRRSLETYNTLVRIGEALAATRKQSRQAARAVLPGGTETQIVVTGNLRAWRDFLEQRWSEHADEEIKEMAGLVLAELREFAPNALQDIPEEPYA